MNSCWCPSTFQLLHKLYNFWPVVGISRLYPTTYTIYPYTQFNNLNMEQWEKILFQPPFIGRIHDAVSLQGWSPAGHGIPSSFQGPNNWGVVQILYDYPRNELNILIQIYSECGSQECVWSMRCQWYNAKTWCFIKSKATLHQSHQPSSDRRPICFFAARMCIIMFQHGSNCWTLEIPGLVMTFTVCHG